MSCLRIAAHADQIGMFMWFYNRHSLKFKGMMPGSIGIVAKGVIKPDDVIIGVHLWCNKDLAGNTIDKGYIDESIQVIKNHGYIPRSAVVCGDHQTWKWGYSPDVPDPNRLRDFLEQIRSELMIEKPLWGAAEETWGNETPRGNWSAKLENGEVKLTAPNLEDSLLRSAPPDIPFA